MGLLRLVVTDGNDGYLLLAAGVVLFQVSVFHEPALNRVTHTATSAITKAISTVAAWFVFGFVLIGWLAHALTRVDVLHRPRAADNGWARMPAPGHQDRSFLHEEPSHRGRWRIRLLAVVVVMAVASYAVWTIAHRPSSRAIRYHEFAFTHEPWGHDTIREFHGTHLERDGALGWRNADYSGRYLNIDDTIRRSWSPAHPVLTVWVFGGSAAFGVGQRDGHTIPSELARLAAADGIRIRVVNFATPAYVAWQEALQLRTELSRRAAPDLIVLYHGANDLADIDRRAEDGSQPLDVPSGLFEREDARFPSGPKGAPQRDPEKVAAAEIRILRAQGAAAREAADAHHVPLIVVWQPSLWSMPKSAWTPELVDAARTNPEHLRAMHHLEELVVAGLGPGVVDLRRSLDQAGQPTFFDVVHTNEAGARIVAEHLYPLLQPRLEQLERDG